MKFQIKDVRIEQELIQLSHPIGLGNDNVYSMLVGRNAVGKTRTLSKIVNNYIFPRNFFSEVVETPDSIHMPARIIAVSNSKFDRFPDPSISPRRHSTFDNGYHYFGLGGFGAGPWKILSKAVETLLSRSIHEAGYGKNLARMLDYVGFMPLIQFEVRRPHRISGKSTVEKSGLHHEEYRRATANLNPESIIFDLDFDSSILPALDYFDRRDRAGHGLSQRLDLANQTYQDDEILEFFEFAAILLQCGLIRVSKFVLYDKRSKDKVLFSKASSGQQCMLLMFMGIMGAITDYSLICIDEPEISLHPKWQAEFIGILQEIFSEFKGCHFVIATHSPQVIAGLSCNNGFVADLENNSLMHSSEYAKRSADFQLTEVFHEPGFRNEYLIRILLVILSKISNKEVLTQSDLAKLAHIESVRDRIDHADPVLHLLHQVKILAKR